MSQPITADRARGALLGLAVGDALGTTLEFTGPLDLTEGAGDKREVSLAQP
jgi:ADP-ribosylglycohydrolase